LPGPLKGFGADTNPLHIGCLTFMNTTRSLLVAAMLSGLAAASFAQGPAAPGGPHAAPGHHHSQPLHHKHHGHRHHHAKHHHGAKGHVGR